MVLMFIVLAYDIANARRRRKISKLMEDYGFRQQLSLFECVLYKEKLADLIRQIKSIIKPREDRVQIYFLCEACKLRSENHCQDHLLADKDVLIC
jgi:CRISPR-associated protein Cas2